MKDFVRILQDYCQLKDYHYSYGRKSNLNLLKSDTLEDKVYLLHEPFPRTPEMSNAGNKVVSYLFTGSFFLLKKSTMDMPYFNEVNNDEARSKYVLNIEPLLEHHLAMANYFGCGDLEVLKFEAIDVVNVLDTNKDGLLISYQVRSNVY
jgi:hypothetical protein